MRTQGTANTISVHTTPTRLLSVLFALLLVTATLPSGVVAVSTPTPSTAPVDVAWNDSSYAGSTGANPTATTVAVANGSVYAGTRADSSTGYLTRFVDGAPAWDVATDTRIPSGLAATDSTVVYGADATSPGGLVERDATGTETNTVATDSLTTDTVVADGVVYSTGADGTLSRTVRAHTRGGTTLWNDTGGGVAQFPSVAVAPETGRLFVSHGDAVTVRDTANGTVVDTLDESGVSYDEVAVAPARNRLYAAVDVDNRTHIDTYALDSLTRVSRKTDAHAEGTEVATLEHAPGTGALVSVTVSGAVAVLDATDHSELGRHSLPTGVNDAAVGAVDGTLGVAYASESEVGLLDTHLPAGDLTGTVVTTDGRALPNATVEVVGVNYSALSPTGQTLDARADDLLADARNATPPTWRPERTLVAGATGDTGNGGVFDRATGRYVAVHTRTDWGAAGPLSDPRLETPRLQVPAGEPVRVSVWDAEAGDSLVADGVDRDLPGETVDGAAVVERLDATGDVVSTVTVETTGEYHVGGAGPFSLATHKYGTVTLAPGFYRIQPADGGASYTVVAGDPADLVETMEQDLRDEAGALTDQATALREQIQSGVFVRRTVRTDSSGRFAVSLPSTVETVSVQAYRADGVLRDLSNPSLGALRAELDAQAQARAFEDANADADADTDTDALALPDTPSVYVSTSPRQVDVPTSSVTVRTRELTTPPYANASRASQTYDQLREFFENQSFAGVTPAMQQAVNETVTTELRGVYADLAGVIRANPVLRERYLDVSGRDSVPAPTALSREELRTAIADANQVLYETAPTDAVDTPDVDADVADETVSLAWALPDAGVTSGTDVDALNLSVVANYANGTTRAVDDEYLSVDSVGPSGTDVTNTVPVVRLSAFPLGDADPASVTFHLRVSGDDVLAERRSTVANPAAETDVPELEALDVSSLSPGPDEEVRVEIVAADDGQVRRLAGADVYAPDGSVRTVDSANVTDGDSVSFVTRGAGLYRVRLRVEDLDGQTRVATFRVRAVEQSTDAPPTLRAVETPLGTVAVVGDDVTDGRVDVDETGVRDVSVTLGDDADRTPPWVHLHTASLSAPPDSTTRVAVEHVDGDVNRSVGLVLHRRGVGTEAVAYRGIGNGDVDQPVTRDGSTRFGRLGGDGESATLRTYSETDGEVSMRVVNAPSLGERVAHRLRVWVSGVAGT